MRFTHGLDRVDTIGSTVRRRSSYHRRDFILRGRRFLPYRRTTEGGDILEEEVSGGGKSDRVTHICLIYLLEDLETPMVLPLQLAQP